MASLVTILLYFFCLHSSCLLLFSILRIIEDLIIVQLYTEELISAKNFYQLLDYAQSALQTPLR